MSVSSTYLSHTVGLSGAIPKAISSKYFMFAITGVKSKHLSHVYISDPNWKNVYEMSIFPSGCSYVFQGKGSIPVSFEPQ